MSWTEERVARLCEMVAAGNSFSQIARALGVTRNAAIGKAQRVGLQSPRRAASPAKVARAPRAPKVSDKVVRLRPRALAQQAAEAALPFSDAPSAGAGVALVDLRAFQCRWPCGDPRAETFVFCGVATEGVYCACHAALAYVQSAPRQGRPLSFAALQGGRPATEIAA